MKKCIRLTSLAVCLCLSVHAQVLNTGRTLKQGHFSFEACPLLIVTSARPAPGILLGAGAGILPGIDLSLYGKISPVTSFTGGRNRWCAGGDIELRILGGMPSLSLSAGGYGNATSGGASVNLNLTFPVKNVVEIYLGPKLDVFSDGHGVEFPFWVFAGVELRLNPHLGIPIEANFGIPPSRPHVFGSGLVVYF